MPQAILVFLLSIFCACAAAADTVKVFVVQKADPNARPGEERVQVVAPTDAELDLVQNMLKSDIKNMVKIEVPSVFGLFRDKLVVIDKAGFTHLSQEQPGEEGEPSLERASAGEMTRIQNGINELLGFVNNLEFQIGIGGAMPTSNNLSQLYHPGFSINVAAGYKLSRAFSLMLALDGQIFDSANDALTNGGYEFSELNVGILAKLRFSTGPVRPFLFAGPGVAENDFNQDTINGNFQTHNSYRGSGSVLAEGGAGVEIQLSRKMFLYAQSSMTFDFTNSDVTSFVNLDNTTHFVPIQVGLFFGY